jgi:hypothetical protein
MCSPGKGEWKEGGIVRKIRMKPESVLVLARDLEQGGKMSRKKVRKTREKTPRGE